MKDNLFIIQYQHSLGMWEVDSEYQPTNSIEVARIQKADLENRYGSKKFRIIMFLVEVVE